jgi:uncharacterized repeat protein (TIGR01451 family)
VDVTAASGGNYVNSLAANALETTNGSNATPGFATLTVTPLVAAPMLGKAFTPATISAGSTSKLTITLSNPETSTVAILSSALIDTLPPGLVVASPSNAGSTCGGGQITAGPGTSTVTLSAGSSIPASTSCTVTVNVTAGNSGNYPNTLATNALQTNNGNNASPAFATLTVTQLAAGPTLGKTFTPATISAGGKSTLTITLNNPSNTVANLIAQLIDRLPSGLIVAAKPNATTTCTGKVTPDPFSNALQLKGWTLDGKGTKSKPPVQCSLGGLVNAIAGGSTVALSAGSSIPANGSCTVTVDVTTKQNGCYTNYIFTNKLPAGALQTNQGNNTNPAFATLTIKDKKIKDKK